MIGYKGSKFKFLNKCSVNQITMIEYDIFDVSVFCFVTSLSYVYSANT